MWGCGRRRAGPRVTGIMCSRHGRALCSGGGRVTPGARVTGSDQVAQAGGLDLRHKLHHLILLGLLRSTSLLGWARQHCKAASEMGTGRVAGLAGERRAGARAAQPQPTAATHPPAAHPPWPPRCFGPAGRSGSGRSRCCLEGVVVGGRGGAGVGDEGRREELRAGRRAGSARHLHRA